MASLKDQIQQELRKEREDLEKPAPAQQAERNDPDARLDMIRPQLDELPHETDQYSLRVQYAVGPYGSDIAIIELYGSNDTWVARWEIAPTVGGSEAQWEVTGKPGGPATYHEWFRTADELFKYLAAAVSERIIQMNADDE